MGVKVHTAIQGERVFPHATDWYVTDDKVLQLYMPHNEDPQFVIMEFNETGWDAVEYDPPVVPPQPNTGESQPEPDATEGDGPMERVHNG